MDASWESPLTAPPLARQCAIAALKRAGGRQAAVQAGCRRGTASERAPKPLCVFWVPHKYADESAAPCGQAKVFRAHVEGEEVKCFIRDAQGNLIFPCGYTGGAKDRISAPCTFESNDVSLSSATGIAQVEKDKEFQLEQAALCLHLGNMLSDEAMDHVKKMCAPGYTLEGGKPVPIEPETEGSSKAKGPGYFYQPHALTAGTGVEGFFGDDAKIPADEVAYLCKVVEDDQAEIKTACIDYFLQFFKAMDEDGKGVLVGDAFKTVIGKLEEDMPMEAKEEGADSAHFLAFGDVQAPWMTPLAAKLIEEAGESGTIDYYKFIEQEMASPRDDAL